MPSSVSNTKRIAKNPTVLKTAFLFIALLLRKSRYYLLIPTFIDIFAAENKPLQPPTNEHCKYLSL